MKIYVGNIPFSFGEEELENLCDSYGPTLDTLVVRYKKSGRSKGYGFVLLESETDASRAIEELNGKEVAGRKLQVELAQSQDTSEFEKMAS